MTDLTDIHAPRPDDDDRGGGYRIRSEATWTLAREAYLDGATAEEACDRFDLSLGAFRERARKGGWRRCDQADPEPADAPGPDGTPFAGDDLDPEAGYDVLADHALRQLRRAMARGRASAAASWMRLHERLTLKAQEAEAQARAAARRAEDAAAPRGPASMACVQLEEQLQARRREAEAYVARRDGAGVVEMASSVALRASDMARRVAALDPRDGVARAALEQELDRLNRDIIDEAGRLMAGIPDDPDDPDAVFDDPLPSPW